MKAEDLRKSILQFAVQGKLVPQYKNDEPASELLKRIQQEKAHLVKEGKLKKEKPLPPIIDDNMLYDLPNGWVWCRLTDITALFNGSIRRGPFGSAIRKDMFVPKGPDTYKVYEQGNAIRKTIDYGSYYISTELYNKLHSFAVLPGDIIISCAGTLGEVYQLPIDTPKGIINQALLRIHINTSIMSAPFFMLVFKAITQYQITQSSIGSAMKNMLSISWLKKNVFFPLPPKEEQIRVLDKVKEMMSFCDKLEASEKEQDKLENHLTEDLPKSILQAAVQGKLVQQDKNDEPASELLKRIHAKKAMLIKEGKLKREKPLPPITEDEIPYDLPDGWVWCRISEIHQIIRGITFPAAMKQHHNAEGLVCCATTGSVQKSYNSSADVFVPVHYVRRDNQWLQDNDIIMSTANSRELVGKSCIWHGKGKKTFGGFLTVLRTQGEIVSQYSYYVFQYLQASGAFNISSTQTTNIANISNETLGITLYPLPPLAEQQRIVVKVDKLIALCEELRHVGDKPIDYSNGIPLPVHVPDTEPLQMVAQGKVAEVQSVKHRAAIKDLLKMMDDE